MKFSVVQTKFSSILVLTIDFDAENMANFVKLCDFSRFLRFDPPPWKILKNGILEKKSSPT
jgi:hypothetical protein